MSPHGAPDQVGPMILDHGEDWPLVDAEVVVVDPSEVGYAVSVGEASIVMEARVERIEEAVAPIDHLAEAASHLLQRGDRDLRRERDAAAGRRGRDRPVIDEPLHGDAARAVAAEAARVAQ